MSSYPTSAMTFRDLIVETAVKAGVAYHGVDGTEEPQVPQDQYDLSECKRHVNNAIRRFIADAPRNGWRWAQPIATLTLWPTVDVDASRTITSLSFDPLTNRTLLQASSDAFYPTMDEHPLVLTGVGTFTIKSFVSATQVYVEGDASAANGVTWSIESDGNYTLPPSFGGQYTGPVTYQAATNQGVGLDWVDESVIRQWRENATIETGDPYFLAVRLMPGSLKRRRWELLAFPFPDEVRVVEFKFDVNFDKLVELADTPPTPVPHDETLRAACRSQVEREVMDGNGVDTEYYQQVCIPNSHRIDERSAPSKLGYFGNPSSYVDSRISRIQVFRQQMYQRPNVSFNP
jgi:hypothetical protein